MSDSTENINQLLAAMHQLQLENENLRESLQKLQARTPMELENEEPKHPPTSRNLQHVELGPSSILAPSPPHPTSSIEPNISLPDKFDGTRAQFRGFINQIKLIIRLQPQRYANDFCRVGLVGTLLSGAAQSWFAPLVETSSPLLDNFSAFLEEFEATFGDTDRRRTSLTKLYSLHQGKRPVSVYASEFRQLSCDVQWDDQALCDHFRRGLRSDVKNLLLNFPEPTSLSQAIKQAVSCDNRLFELRQEEWATSKLSSFLHAKPMVHPQVTARSSPMKSFNDPMPMEMDRARAPLTAAERHHRRTKGLCLYCGDSNHLIRFCPLKSNLRQVSRDNPTHRSQHSGNDNVQPQ